MSSGGERELPWDPRRGVDVIEKVTLRPGSWSMESRGSCDHQRSGLIQMASQLVCGWGLRFAFKGGTTGGATRCPVCGGALKVSTASRATSDREPMIKDG